MELQSDFYMLNMFAFSMDYWQEGKRLHPLFLIPIKITTTRPVAAME
jgi:hypothetical protein